ncbi:MAG: hypothetical protein BHW66_12835 [Akkermansia sp. 54_46]|nr:MAG: hypothetical protein BHW66_12835 [Akkermansia sp. 54_46]
MQQAPVPPDKYKDCAFFSGRFIRIMSRFLIRKIFQGACLKYARNIISEEGRGMREFPHPARKDNQHETMSRRLQPTERREWYSTKDVEEVYGISRKTLERIRKNAKDEGKPIKVSRLPFQNGSETTRRRPFIRISKKSLDEYMNSHAEQDDDE